VTLLEPLELRGHSVPSRVMFGPHETNLGSGRSFSPRHVAYYARRAAGGAGFIVLEEASVHSSDHPYERAPLAAECADGWSDVVAGIRATGTSPVVLAALGHAGGQGTSHWHQGVMWAPSAVPEVASREVPKVMEAHEIDAVVHGFAAAAASAVAAGLHGVEINAGQYSLVRQFLSGLTNMRADEYGTDRLRFAREVLTAARSGVGAEGIVALRLCVDELAPWAGIVPDAGAEIAAALAEHVDMITVVRGSIFTTWATRPDAHVEPGFAIELARHVKAAAPGVVVVAQGSIVDVGQAQWAIESGACDAVEMTRAQLADADLIRKLRAGRPERIRPCILCNQVCKVRDNRNPIVSCVADPRTGHELDDPDDPDDQTGPDESTASRDTLRSLCIVGAGVAGLECARVAAARGRSVRVLERSNAPGGAAVVAALGSGRGRIQTLVDWLRSECVRLGVQFEYGHAVAPAELAELQRHGDVVLCTGGVAVPAPFPGPVVQAADALLGAELPSGAVAVWDPIGGPIAISVAETLAQRGHQVVLITPDLLVGEKLALSGDLAPAQNRLHGAGIQLVKQAIVRNVTSAGVQVEDRFSGVVEVIAAGSVVVCGHSVPDHTLDPEETLPQAGDRVAPRSLYEAVLEGRRCAQAPG
jgi:mycofactocin system FadH/OYE family oxidoreductase 1